MKTILHNLLILLFSISVYANDEDISRATENRESEVQKELEEKYLALKKSFLSSPLDAESDAVKLRDTLKKSFIKEVDCVVEGGKEYSQHKESYVFNHSETKDAKKKVIAEEIKLTVKSHDEKPEQHFLIQWKIGKKKNPSLHKFSSLWFRSSDPKSEGVIVRKTDKDLLFQVKSADGVTKYCE